MCGRMTLTASGDEIARYFAEAMAVTPAPPGGGSGETLRPRFNLTPGQNVLTVVPGLAGAGLVMEFAWKRWGLVPPWADGPALGHRLFNARAETVAEKPSFRSAYARRRCLVVADGFYEWTPRERGHRPFLFRSSRSSLLTFAGLFESWRGTGGEGVESCTVLTTAANADLEGVHHRMPVILETPARKLWLDAKTSAPALAGIALPAPSGTLMREPVSSRVNDPRHDDPACWSPAERAEQGSLFSTDGDVF